MTSYKNTLSRKKELRRKKLARKKRRRAEVHARLLSVVSAFPDADKKLVPKELGLRQVARNIKQVIPPDKTEWEIVAEAADAFSKSMLNLADEFKRIFAEAERVPMVVVDSMGSPDPVDPPKSGFRLPISYIEIDALFNKPAVAHTPVGK